MRNRDIYERDPAGNRLLNQGVAKLTNDRSEAEIRELRYELVNFVCEGQYEEGLRRIIEAYLRNLDRTEQPGVWVSGFYGSGKSHLVKMLQHLWTDFSFPDGATARGLTRLSDRVKESLVELTNRSRRYGGLHAAAGTLGAGANDSTKLELLGIIFRSVGLPDRFAQATFLLWLRSEGLEEQVRAFVRSQQRDFDKELLNLYVSDTLARAILNAKPDFASDPKQVRTLLSKEFPQPDDISTDVMLARARQALEKDGRLPCTLFILDEAQQYIGENAERSRAFQELQEQCCVRLGPNVLFVATGQTALSGTSLLQRLMGRFPVSIELQDTDVERVTREVVLKKKPSAESAVKGVLDKYSGEIDRQLRGTTVAPTASDREWLVQDYPLLPSRRRIWERILRAVDKTGTGSQLRTQLWMVHDAAERTADLTLGTVVSGAFVFEHVRNRVLQSGILLQEISEKIARQGREPDGELREAICALIFLIGQLPESAGIRANAETLADLLITDLSRSAETRNKVPQLLEKLVESAAIMRTDDVYRMQTREGSEWYQVHHLAVNELLGDPGKLSSVRADLLKTACVEHVGRQPTIQQGDSKTPRRLELRFGDTEPPQDESRIPVWIRDGWTTDERTVLSDARSVGENAAVVYGFIPRKRAEELNGAIADFRAAQQTLERKGVPSTDEGRHARHAMETREKQAENHLNRLVAEILEDAVVYVAGGDSVHAESFKERVFAAAESCLTRLYPQFDRADHPAAQWKKVFDRARQSDAGALSAVGYQASPLEHPVCAAILSYVGSGKRGTEIRKQFGGPPYGWPQDAVDAALVVLHHAGALQVRSGSEPMPKGKLDQRSIPTAEFRAETVTLTTVELIRVRGVYKKAGVEAKTGEETAKCPAFLERLRILAESAGGEPPRPKRPDTSHLDEIANRTGNDQLKTVADCAERLTQEVEEWNRIAASIAQRMPRWGELRSLLRHAEDLPVAGDIGGEVRAIEAQRALLADPDPIAGLTSRLTQALRDELNAVHGECVLRYKDGWKTLFAGTGRIAEDSGDSFTNRPELNPIPDIAVGSTAEILATLDARRLSEWRSLRDALPTRFEQARAEAAKRREPKAQSVQLRRTTIRDESELNDWLSDAESLIREKLKEGPVIL